MTKLVAIRITAWMQGLFCRFVTIGRYGRWLKGYTDTDTHTDLAELVRHALAEVCTVLVLLISSMVIMIVKRKMMMTMMML